MYNIILEILALVNIFLVNGYAILKKNRFILILYWIGFLFSIFYEIHGTGFQWNYPDYNIYLLYGKIPFALIFGWPWWIVYIATISNFILKKFNLLKWYQPLFIDYFVATIFGVILEIIAVYLGWWTYTAPKPPLIPNISFMVWIAWGIPVAILIHFARWFDHNLSRRHA